MAVTSILASLGTAAGISMALSPLPTIRSILSTRSTGDFSVFPYIATLCQCALWISYALATPGKTALIPVNALVSALELAYCIIFFMFANDRSAILKTIAYPAAVTGAALLISFLASSPSKFLGFFAVISNIIMYAAPLTVVKTVIETRSVKYMPLLLSLVGTVSASIWTAWAFSAGDKFVLIPNVLGFILGCIQLGVYYKYKDANPRATESEVSSLNTGDLESQASPKRNGETRGLIK